MKKILFFLLLFLIELIQGQVQIQTVDLLNTIKITFTYTATRTNFLITTKLGNKVSINNAWIGIGFNDVPLMVRFIF